jgi:G3E family GTPase
MTVLGGFLGAGKSTWLRHHLARGALIGARVIVNEAAATSVDHLLLDGAAQVTVLAGGCACCDRKADLMSLLLHAAATPWPADEPTRRIVLELSGLADPRPVVEAVRGDTALAARLELSETVVLLGAPDGYDRLRREPLARRQVSAADCVIVTKCDEADEAALARLLAAVTLLNPAAPLFGSVRGLEVPLPPPGVVQARDLPDIGSDGDASPLRAARLTIGHVDWSTVALWLSALLAARGPDVARVKGVVSTPAGRLLVQAVGRRVQSPEILPGPAEPDDGLLVVIGRGFEPADIQRSFEAFGAVCRDAEREQPSFTAFRPAG